MGVRSGMALAVACATAVVGGVVQPAPAAPRGSTTLVSVASDGTPADAPSYGASFSGDGRFVAFTSFATNLVPGGTPGGQNIYVHDRRTGGTERVSVPFDGVDGQESWYPAISGDGRYVAFTSQSSHLVPGDTNDRWDVFVRDRWTDTTTLASVTSSGAQADNASEEPAISADGRYVAFQSNARNLAGVDSNGDLRDVFVRDRALGVTTRVSVTPAGVGGNAESRYASISADGRYVMFLSFATDLVDDGSAASGVFVRDMWTGVTTRASLTSLGAAAERTAPGAISADGRFVAFYTDAPGVVPGDTNGTFDVFVRDRVAGTTTRVSVATGGGEADLWSYAPALSADGRFVAFMSFATNLVPGDTNDAMDVFVHDRRTGGTRRVSVSCAGGDADSASDSPSISPNGRYVGFSSYATNLVPGDTNGVADVFVRVR